MGTKGVEWLLRDDGGFVDNRSSGDAPIITNKTLEDEAFKGAQDFKDLLPSNNDIPNPNDFTDYPGGADDSPGQGTRLPGANTPGLSPLAQSVAAAVAAGKNQPQTSRGNAANAPIPNTYGDGTYVIETRCLDYQGIPLTNWSAGVSNEKGPLDEEWTYGTWNSGAPGGPGHLWIARVRRAGSGFVVNTYNQSINDYKGPESPRLGPGKIEFRRKDTQEPIPPNPQQGSDASATTGKGEAGSGPIRAGLPGYPSGEGDGDGPVASFGLTATTNQDGTGGTGVSLSDGDSGDFISTEPGSGVVVLNDYSSGDTTVIITGADVPEDCGELVIEPTDLTPVLSLLNKILQSLGPWVS